VVEIAWRLDVKRNGCFFGFSVLVFVLAVNGALAAQTLGPLEGDWQGGRQRLVFTGNRMFVGDEYGEDDEFEFLMVRQVTNREIRVFESSEDEDEAMYYKLRGNALFLYETEEDYNAETGRMVFARIGNVGKSPLEGVWEGDDDILIEFTGNMVIFDKTDAYEFSCTDKQLQFSDESWSYTISGGTLSLIIPDEGKYVFARK
jgi:hypothetical protein